MREEEEKREGRQGGRSMQARIRLGDRGKRTEKMCTTGIRVVVVVTVVVTAVVAVGFSAVHVVVVVLVVVVVVVTHTVQHFIAILHSRHALNASIDICKGERVVTWLQQTISLTYARTRTTLR